MSLLSFNYDAHFIYAIIYWILEIIIRILMYTNWEYFQMSDDNVQNEYLYVIISNIGDLLSGFLVLYTKCSTKSKNPETRTLSKTSSQIELIYEDTENYKNQKFIRKMIIIGILEYISRSLYWMAYAITKAKREEVSHQLQKDLLNTLDIFMRYIFSIFILKVVFHKHRLFSIYLIAGSFIVLLISDFFYVGLDEKLNLVVTLGYVGIIAFRAVSYPLVDTFIRQLFEDNYILPDSLMFIKSLIQVVSVAIITPILYYSFGVQLDIHFGTENIIIIIVYILAHFVKQYFLLKIIYHFSAQSASFLVISESVSGSITGIIDFFKDEDKQFFDIFFLIIEFLAILLIAFATLTYDEIIIIHKCGLDENTKGGIINRAQDEMIKLNDIVDDSDFDNKRDSSMRDSGGSDNQNDNRESNADISIN